jgi:SagB-type dehydrogenase family enzyme
MIRLPEPALEGALSVETALRYRRSGRDYAAKPLGLAALSQLLWAAQGITNRQGDRTAPSAGALFPLELYVAAGEVGELETGIYKYVPRGHQLAEHADVDVRAKLASLAWRQTWVKDAPAILVFTTVAARVTDEYGSDGIRYVYMEVGHAAQNVHLQAVALDLATCVVGALDAPQVTKTLALAPDEVPEVLMPVAYPKRKPRRRVSPPKRV